MKIGLFFQEITSITEFRGSNFLLPTFLAGSKWDFPVADLLLATVNFEPWEKHDCIPTRLRYDNLRAITIYNIQSLLICPFKMWDL